MPAAALHPCNAPRCKALVPRGQSRCTQHERAYDLRRGTSTERGYDSRWRAYRRGFLASHRLCVECFKPATVVDHIVPHKGNARLFWDPTNHRALCKSCHDARVDEGDFGLVVLP